LEDQITIVAVATCHEKNRRGRRELPARMDWTRDFFGRRHFRAATIMETPALASEELPARP
jgi:hypothetical protein